MSRRKKRSGRSVKGRFLESAAGIVMLAVVLAFGISIAVRWSGRTEEAARVEPMAQPLPPPSLADVEAMKQRPTVDIRNGCGQAGLAEVMMQRCRRAGFDVVEYKNADRYDYERTLVRDRSGKPGAAIRARDWLRAEFNVGELVEDRAAVPEADILLVLGADLADTLKAREARGE